MPWFSRSDGDLVRGLPAMRRIMPYVMRGRNESAVYVPCRIDVAKAKRWLWAYNRAHPDAVCTIFGLALYVAKVFLKEFPDFDRFVAGRRIWQRKETTISLVVKESLELAAPAYTIKISLGELSESLPEFSRRITEALRAGAELQKRAEDEARLLLRFPDPVVRLVLWSRDRLDEWGLLPSRYQKDDPLCTSMFISNLGSIGIPEAFHHLYESGTCSAFAVFGAVQKESLIDADGTSRACDILPVSWTVDDRVADGFRCAEALRWYQSRLEDPSLLLGTPEAAASAAPDQTRSATAKNIVGSGE